MKTILCQIHGVVEAILTDWILLRYKCKKCVDDEKEEK